MNQMKTISLNKNIFEKEFIWDYFDQQQDLRTLMGKDADEK